MRRGPAPRPVAARFWEKVDKRGPDECWPWIGTPGKRGYGAFKAGGRMFIAHRIAWELAHGPIPQGMCVLHRCDNPPCVNVHAHLFLGTSAENNTDRHIKGRDADRRGEKGGGAKLTESDVRSILAFLAEGMTQREAAKAFNIHFATVNDIARRKTWLNVTQGANEEMIQ